MKPYRLFCSILCATVLSVSSLAAQEQGSYVPLPADRAPNEAAPIRPAAGENGTGIFIVGLKTAVEGSVYELELTMPLEARKANVLRTIFDILDQAQAPLPPGREEDWLLVGAIDGFNYEYDPAVLERIAQDERVHVIEEDVIITLDQTVLNGTLEVQNNPKAWGLDRIDQRPKELDGRFTHLSFNTPVYAYVVDSGVREDHVEFEDRARNVENYVDRSDTDCTGHGTHVAATIAGKTVGIAKSAIIQSYKVFGCEDVTSGKTIHDALNDIFEDRRLPGVVNLSLSSAGVSELQVIAVQRLRRVGLIVVAAAGNDLRANACNVWPAGAPDAIAVGASDRRDRSTFFTNIGSCVDLFAPGDDVLSAGHRDAAHLVSKMGTSMAAPHVAGVALMLAAQNPKMSVNDLRQYLIDISTKDALTQVPNGTANRLLYFEPLSEPKPMPDPPKPQPSCTAATLSASMTQPHKILTTLEYWPDTPPLADVPIYCEGDDIRVSLAGSECLAELSVTVEQIDPMQEYVYDPVAQHSCTDCAASDALDVKGLARSSFATGMVYTVNIKAKPAASARDVGKMGTQPVLTFGLCACGVSGQLLDPNYCSQ